MARESIRRDLDQGILRLTFDRAAEKNRIGSSFLRELGALLDDAERASDVRVIVLRAEGDHFSSGMDFAELVAEPGPADVNAALPLCDAYFRTLRRLRTIAKLVVAEVHGKAVAGGVGLVAASDIVVAAPDSSFALPEILWGMVPAMVLPFLARRVGDHHAYKLALTSAPMSAADAHERGLVDEVHADPQVAIRRMLPRLVKLDPAAVACLKSYAHEIAAIDGRVAELAMRTTASLMLEPSVRRRIDDFVTHHRLPWEGAAS